jgi:hypothetical protein
MSNQLRKVSDSRGGIDVVPMGSWGITESEGYLEKY